MLLRSSLICLLLVGCAVPHAAEHAENLTNAAAHKIAVETCVDEGIATIQTTDNRDKAQLEYEACVAAADKKYGRK